MILLDTSGLLSALDASQPGHDAARRVLEADAGPFVLSPFVLAELDYLVGRMIGSGAQLALLAEVALGSYELAGFGSDDVGAARSVVESYADMAIGLADASVVVLANRHRTDRVLTFDQRHFRVLRTAKGDSFRILPADAA